MDQRQYKNDNRTHDRRADLVCCREGHRQEGLCNKRLFVVDTFCGRNKDTRMAIRFIVEVAQRARCHQHVYQAHR